MVLSVCSLHKIILQTRQLLVLNSISEYCAFGAESEGYDGPRSLLIKSTPYFTRTCYRRSSFSDLETTFKM